MKFSQLGSPTSRKTKFKQNLNAPITQKSIYDTFTAILAKCKLGFLRLGRKH